MPRVHSNVIFIARFWIASMCKESLLVIVMPDTRAVLQDRSDDRNIIMQVGGYCDRPVSWSIIYFGKIFSNALSVKLSVIASCSQLHLLFLFSLIKLLSVVKVVCINRGSIGARWAEAGGPKGRERGEVLGRDSEPLGPSPPARESVGALY